MNTLSSHYKECSNQSTCTVAYKKQRPAELPTFHRIYLDCFKSQGNSIFNVSRVYGMMVHLLYMQFHSQKTNPSTESVPKARTPEADLPQAFMPQAFLP